MKHPKISIGAALLCLCAIPEGETHAGVTVLNPSENTVIQENAPDDNFGSNQFLNADSKFGGRRALIEFNLSSISGPITSAVLTLDPTPFSITGYTFNIYSLTTAWTQGSQNGVTATAGASWNSAEAENSLLWTTPGGDFSLASDVTYSPSSNTFSVDITSIVNGWLTGNPNDGLIITGSTGGNAAAFPDTNNSPSSTWPALTITTAAPEPGTFSLLGFAALAVVFTRRPRKRA